MGKDSLRIVIVGHVDHGKSTLIGRLLLDTNSLPKEKITEIKKISKELGKDTEMAYVVDQLKEERERNITIDTTQIFFNTRKRNYIIIDAPGHLEFIKNMITGASMAEAAILIVDVKEGVREQTRRHSYILNMLGIKEVMVVFNKMDLIGYEQERYNKVKDEIVEFLHSLKITPFFTIPLSAKEGGNVSETSSEMPWYKGPHLLKALDSLKVKTKTAESPLRFCVQDIYDIDGEKIIAGKVLSGIINQGQKILSTPTEEEAVIKDIKVFNSHKRRAQKGENIGLVLDKSLEVARGEIFVAREDHLNKINQFKGNIFWMSNEPLQKGKTFNLRCSTQEVGCVVEKIERRINSSTLELIEEDASEIRINEVGMVTFQLKKEIIIEDFSFIEELGRFVLESNYNLEGAGIVT